MNDKASPIGANGSESSTSSPGVRLLDGLQTADRWLALGEEVMMTAMLLGLMLVAVAQSLMRNLEVGSGAMLANLLILIKYQTFFLGILGASLATHHNRHINVDVLSKKLGPVGRKVVRVLTGVAVMTVAGFLVLSVYEFIASQQLAMRVEKHASREVLWGITEMHLMWAVFMIFAALLVHLVVRWIVDVAGLALGLQPETGRTDRTEKGE